MWISTNSTKAVKNNYIRQAIQKMATALFVTLLLMGLANADGELQLAELGECKLENGEVILNCRVAFRTLGKLNADKSNVMVFPSWYGGTSQSLIDYDYIGPGKIADTDRYFVIAIDALSDGVSSSPSNSPQQAMGKFPQISFGDMVDAQHRLLTEYLNIDHVDVVIGASMGGMQVFEWIMRYPGFMNKAVAIEGTPWPTPYDLMLWSAWMEAAEVYDGSEASLQRSTLLLAQLDGLTLWTPAYLNEMISTEDFSEFMAGFTPKAEAGSLLDRKVQTHAILNHNISAGINDFSQHAADLIKAELLVVVFSQDHMVNPNPSLELAEMIGASQVVLDSSCAHMAPNPECDQIEVSRKVNAFLQK